MLISPAALRVGPHPVRGKRVRFRRVRNAAVTYPQMAIMQTADSCPASDMGALTLPSVSDLSQDIKQVASKACDPVARAPTPRADCIRQAVTD